MLARGLAWVALCSVLCAPTLASALNLNLLSNITLPSAVRARVWSLDANSFDFQVTQGPLLLMFSSYHCKECAQFASTALADVAKTLAPERDAHTNRHTTVGVMDCTSPVNQPMCHVRFGIRRVPVFWRIDGNVAKEYNGPFLNLRDHLVNFMRSRHKVAQIVHTISQSGPIKTTKHERPNAPIQDDTVLPFLKLSEFSSDPVWWTMLKLMVGIGVTTYVGLACWILRAGPPQFDIPQGPLDEGEGEGEGEDQGEGEGQGEGGQGEGEGEGKRAPKGGAGNKDPQASAEPSQAVKRRARRRAKHDDGSDGSDDNNAQAVVHRRKPRHKPAAKKD